MKLTAREKEVITHISRGLGVKESGSVLGISPRTVQVHRNNIRLKLGFKTALQLHVYSARRKR